MKKLPTLLIIGTSLVGFAATAGSLKPAQFVAADDSAASALCVTVAQGNPSQVRNAVANIKPASHLKQNYQFVVNNISCNGEEVVDFALSTGNDRVATALAKHRFGTIKIQDVAMRYQGRVNLQ